MLKKIFAFLAIIIFVISFGVDADAASKRKRKNTSSNQAVSTIPDSVLPKRGDIAVLVEGDDEQHVRITESKIIDSLVNHGYRVVDEKKMKAIKAAAVRAQAARYALEGNVEGILRLNGSYSCAATVIARVQAGQPVQNQFQLYTGNASIAIIAVTSRGTKLGGKTAMSKQVAFSEYETQVKSIEAAVEDGMSQMY